MTKLVQKSNFTSEVFETSLKSQQKKHLSASAQPAQIGRTRLKKASRERIGFGFSIADNLRTTTVYVSTRAVCLLLLVFALELKRSCCWRGRPTAASGNVPR